MIAGSNLANEQRISSNLSHNTRLLQPLLLLSILNQQYTLLPIMYKTGNICECANHPQRRPVLTWLRPHYRHRSLWRCPLRFRRELSKTLIDPTANDVQIASLSAM